jgi:putative hydrolase of the HAD superfamily
MVHSAVPGPHLHELLGVDRDLVNRVLFDQSEMRLTGRISDPAEVVADIAARCGVDVSAEECASHAAIRSARFAQSLRGVLPHILDTLDCLRAHGRRLGLISNADTMEAAGWDESPLADRFECVLFSCDVGIAKPDPSIYHLCMDRMGVNADQCIFVGDGGSNEFDGARDAGIPTVCTVEFIRDIFPEKVAPQSARADCVVETLAELCRAVSR